MLAKGTKDSPPEKERLKQAILEECENQFLLYDAVRMDTPTFELLSFLEKHRTTEQDIFVLENEMDKKYRSALRYDLTISFSRYTKQHHIKSMRRYQIGKVFRKEQIKSDRYREFYQCDYDCLGGNLDWIIDAETIVLLDAILMILKNKYNLPDYIIRVNSRIILLEILTFCDIPHRLASDVYNSIDKLDKPENWNFIALELEEKGIAKGSIKKLKKIMTYSDISFVKNKSDFEKTFNLLKNRRIPIVLDLTLVKNQDYYTGIIFEVMLNQKSVSIASGGRYNKLCPSSCVGFSLGIDRILNHVSYYFDNFTKVWLISMGLGSEDLLKYKFDTLIRFRQNGIPIGTEDLIKNYHDSKEALNVAIKNNISFVIFVGSEEVNNNKLTLKIIKIKEETSIKNDTFIFSEEEELAYKPLKLKIVKIKEEVFGTFEEILTKLKSVL